MNNDYIKLVDSLKSKLKLDENRVAIYYKYTSLGDTWYGLSALKHAQKVLNKQIVWLCCTQRMVELASYLSNNDFKIETLVISEQEKQIITSADKETADAYNDVLINTVHNREVFDLLFWSKKNGELLRPKFPEFDKEKYIKEYGIIPGKTVIISPLANTVQSFPDYVWNVCADLFRFMGYQVVFNITEKEQSRFNGPMAFVPYCDLVNFVNLCGYAFGIRSGFFDFVSSSTADMTIFSTKIYSPINERFEIEGAENRIRTFYLDEQDLFFDKFPLIKYINSHFKPTIEALETQIALTDKNLIDSYDTPKEVKGYEYSPAKNKAVKENSEVLTNYSFNLKYSFKIKNDLVCFCGKNLDFDKTTLNINVFENNKKTLSLVDYQTLDLFYKPKTSAKVYLEIIITEKRTGNQAVYTTQELDCNSTINLDIKNIVYVDAFEEYSKLLTKFKDDIIIAVSGKDAYSKKLVTKHNEFFDFFKSLGFETDLEHTFRHSFAGIYDGSITEKVSESNAVEVSTTFDKLKVRAYSEGYNFKGNDKCASKIIIDGHNWSVNSRGLNIVVIDKKSKTILDSVAFDSYTNWKIKRKKVR